MNVVILTEAGKGIGLGHLTRCIALYQAFKQKKVQVKLIVNVKRSEKLPIDKSIRICRYNWLKDKRRLFSDVSKAKIVVIDSYLAQRSLYEAIALRVTLSVYIDDNRRLNYPPGVVLNASIYAEDLAYPQKRNILYLLGPKYSLLRSQFRQITKKSICKSITSILITFGGTDPLNLTEKTCAILSKHYPNITQFPVRGDGSASMIKHLMKRCDIAISAAGQTLFELASVGVPALIVCVALNQKQNLKAYGRLGYLPLRVQHFERDLLKSMEKIRDFAYRREVSQRAAKIIHRDGALNVVQELLNLYKTKRQRIETLFKIRPVTRADCRDLWQWRNAPQGRRFCFHKQYIPYRNHKAWFDKKLQDPSVKIYLAENHRGVKMGQVRFEQGNGCTQIHISLNPEYYGRGLGGELIRKSSKHYFRQRNVKEINARIHEGNWLSIRAFQKAGYRFDIMYKKRNIRIYQYKVAEKWLTLRS